MGLPQGDQKNISKKAAIFTGQSNNIIVLMSSLHTIIHMYVGFEVQDVDLR